MISLCDLVTIRDLAFVYISVCSKRHIEFHEILYRVFFTKIYKHQDF
jgi:hypothetical protein